MPTFVPAVRCARVIVYGTQAAQPASFGFEAQFPTTPSDSDFAALLSAMDGWITSDLQGVMCAGSHISGIEVRDVAVEDGYVDDSPVDYDGTADGDCQPAQVAVVITKYTGLAGRSRRGRLYCWGVSGAFLEDERHITSAQQVVYSSAFTDLGEAVSDAGWTPVVVSRISAGTPRTTGLVTPITSFVCRDARLDTQRRRLGKA